MKRKLILTSIFLILGWSMMDALLEIITELKK